MKQRRKRPAPTHPSVFDLDAVQASLSDVPLSVDELQRGIDDARAYGGLSSLCDLIDGHRPLDRDGLALISKFLLREAQMKPRRGRRPERPAYMKGILFTPLEHALQYFRVVKRRLRDKGRVYGSHEAVLKHVAERFGIPINTLRNAARRARPEKRARK